MRDVNFWDIIMLLGVLQGLILGTVILLTKKSNTTSGKLIAIILFIIAFALLGNFTDAHPVSENYPAVQWIALLFPFYFIMGLGPSIYLFTKSQLLDTYQINRQELRHFYAIGFNLIPSILTVGYIIANTFGIRFFQVSDIDIFLSHYYRYGDVLFWIHITVYLILSKRLMNTYQNPPKNSKTTLSDQWLHTFLNIFLCFQALWLPYLIIYISDYDYLIWEYSLDYYYIYIPLVALTYWISIKWLFVSKEISAIQLKENNIKKVSIILSEDEIKTYTDRLHVLMTIEEFYLNPGINVKDIADEIKVTPKTLSHFLNQHLETNFNDFVNRYRIDVVKEKLTNPDQDHLTIAAIAFESGFTSIPTFQRAFKNFEKISPKEYKKNTSK